MKPSGSKSHCKALITYASRKVLRPKEGLRMTGLKGTFVKAHQPPTKIGEKKWAEPTFWLRPLRSGVKSNLFVAAGLFHAGADAVAAFEAHDAFVHAEGEHPIPHWNCAVQRQAGVLHAMPFLTVGATVNLTGSIDNRQQTMTDLVVVQGRDLCLRQVRGHRLPDSALLLAE